MKDCDNCELSESYRANCPFIGFPIANRRVCNFYVPVEQKYLGEVKKR